ncbi:TPA: hypothetical protein EYP66_13345 [Candidatus Poribacteria bacterium]|nr:hypothetical protein [Candidatus Poribacteria bacterium]
MSIFLFTPVVFPEEQLPVGVRAIGMGSAFTAVADDGAAISWNPAGVSLLGRYTINLMRAKLFDVGTTNYLSVIVPASEKLAIGMDWTHLGIEDEEINFSQNEVNFSYSYQPLEDFSVGVNLKYIVNNLSYDRSSVGTSSGWGTDFGVMFLPFRFARRRTQFLDKFTFGFVAADALGLKSGKFSRGTSVKYDTGASDTIFSPSYRWGLAYKPIGDWLLALSVDDRIHVGAEFSPHDILNIRAGIEKDLHTSEYPTYSVGGTIKYRWMNFNYAYVIPPTLPSTLLFSLSLAFEFQRPPVRIEKVRLKDIYPIHQYYYANRPNYAAKEIVLEDYAPVLYSEADLNRFYSFEPEDTIGRIWLENITNKPISLKVKLYIDKYVGKKGTDVISQLQLQPRQRISAPLRRIVLTDEALTITQPKTVEATIEVIDITDEGRRKATASATLLLHGRNNAKLDDIAKLAAFISPENKAVREFALGVLGLYESELAETSLNQNLYKAMLLFDALHGMNYAIDSNIPYGSGQKDEIKFPQGMLRQFTLFNAENSQNPSLRSRAGPDAGKTMIFGDCDDSTVLYSALLEAAGIHTALIQQVGHVLMAFDVGGLTLERAQELGIPNKLYTAIGGYVWIPIETTLIKEGFVKAWQDAKDGLQKGIVDSISLQQAWEEYGSVNIGGDWTPKIPPKVQINSAVSRDLESEWMETAARYFKK